MYTLLHRLFAATLSLVSVSAQLRTPQGSSFGVPGVNASFDYVIVGGGTAGLTLATRLAENPAVTVAVIEAGGFYEEDNGDISVIDTRGSFILLWMVSKQLATFDRLGVCHGASGGMFPVPFEHRGD